MRNVDRLMSAQRPYLTDGGLHTTLFLADGFQAPEFAAILLLDNVEARDALGRYFDHYLEMAATSRSGFVLNTVTWRGCVEWAPKLGRSAKDLMRLSRDAVALARGIRSKWQGRVSPLILSGTVGPAGDGYAPEFALDPATAILLHGPQLRVFADEGVDMVCATTMTHVGEAVGIVQAAQRLNLPVVVSFTVDTDGCLPMGDPLGEAIAATDAATSGAPLYYMVNCAHPDHFRAALQTKAEWVTRIGGLRANASRLSHAELDGASALDDGDPQEFGRLHRELAALLPNLRVIGGCCGTDHRHIASISHHLRTEIAA
ncbi:MAG: homocysteine S-methyltransferase family protein [Pseudomonadota bacterium]